MSTYQPLPQLDEKFDAVPVCDDQDEEEVIPRRQRLTKFCKPSYFTKAIHVASWTVQLLLLALSASMLYLSRFENASQRCLSLSDVSSWTPAFEAVEYEPQTFRGDLYHVSPWKGQPNAELEALWARVGQVGAMSISTDEVRKLGKDPDFVIRWPEEYGGGHFASVEVFHHLHCLNFLRKTTYWDYYQDVDLAFTEGKVKLRRQMDHCVDIIRQALMCNGDMTLMTYNWIKDNPAPYPDFDTQHQCRNFTKLLEWGEATMVKAPMNAVNPNNRLGVKVKDA